MKLDLVSQGQIGYYLLYKNKEYRNMKHLKKFEHWTDDENMMNDVLDNMNKTKDYSIGGVNIEELKKMQDDAFSSNNLWKISLAINDIKKKYITDDPVLKSFHRDAVSKLHGMVMNK